MKPLTICIDARYCDGRSGGIEQVVIGLAHGLSRLDGGSERYLFLGGDEAARRLNCYLSGPCGMLPVETPKTSPRRRWLERVIRGPSRRWRGSPGPRPNGDGAPLDRLVRRARVNVMHFTVQFGFSTSIPNIYHPHDLQHLHLPHLFSRADWEHRESVYRSMCANASMVAVTSSWIRDDVIQKYGLPEGKVRVVPWAPVLPAYSQPNESDVARARTELSLPEKFLFYPAQTWPHKNHLGLLEALAILRDRHGLKTPFVSSGRRNEFFSVVEGRVRELGLTDQVRFVGFLSPLLLQCLYRLCRAVVIPTKFEAASFPLWESFLAGAPAACSNVTSLPAQAGDAALVFDPDRPEEIAEAVRRLWTDEPLRLALSGRGRTRVADFTWDRTARSFRAHYRRLGGRALSEEDQELLASTPLL